MKSTLQRLLCLACLAFLPVHAEDTNTLESARIRWATEELAKAKEALASTTNEVERALQERRIDITEKALANYQLQAELDIEERTLSQERHRSTDFMLRKALSSIETDEISPKHAVSSHNIEIRKLKERRGFDEQRRAKMAADPKSSMAELARSEASLANIDAEIMSQMLARDTEEYKIRLAREAKRIDAVFSSVEQDVRVTIRMLLDAHRDIKRNRERLEECDAIGGDLKTQLEDTYSAVEIAQQRIGQLKQEIDLLTDRTQVEKEDEGVPNGEETKKRGMFGKLFRPGTKAERQLNQMIKDVESEIELLSERIVHLRKQCVSMHNTLELIEQGRELFEAESSYLINQLVTLKKRYTRRILLPIAVVGTIALFYLLVSHLILPLILKHDHLFIARRLGSYITILIIILVLIGFFLEDLKHIAAIMGIVGAAIVIALQDMCSAFAGWFVIIASRKLRVGDRVEINGVRGEIIDIEMLRTTLVELNNWLEVDEATGRTIIIPNSFIFKSEVFNYSHVHPYIWGKADITVTFESPPEKTYALLFKALEETTRDAYAAAAKGGELMAKRYGLSRAIFEPHIHTFIADSGVCYSLFYVAHYRRFTAMRDKIMERVIQDVARAPGIEFAYPTERHLPTPPGVPPAPIEPAPSQSSPSKEE
jgi:small-conductance mechanosensitive channel